MGMRLRRTTHFWKSPSRTRKAAQRGSFLLTSVLAADNLSEEIDAGIGGTFIIVMLIFSDEDLLPRDSDDGVLLKLKREEVSLLVFELVILSGRTISLDFGVVDRTECSISGPGGRSSLMSLEARGDALETAGRGGVMGFSVVKAELFVGEWPPPFSGFFAILFAGDGDLELLEIHDLRARLRIVPLIERPGILGRSEPSGSCTADPLGVPFCVKPSSCEPEDFGAGSFFLTFREAFRNICLFAATAAVFDFVGVLDGNARSFSENVRLIPVSGGVSVKPGM